MHVIASDAWSNMTNERVASFNLRQTRGGLPLAHVLISLIRDLTVMFWFIFNRQLWLMWNSAHSFCQKRLSASSYPHQGELPSPKKAPVWSKAQRGMLVGELPVAGFDNGARRAQHNKRRASILWAHHSWDEPLGSGELPHGWPWRPGASKDRTRGGRTWAWGRATSFTVMKGKTDLSGDNHSWFSAVYMMSLLSLSEKSVETNGIWLAADWCVEVSYCWWNYH